MHHAKSDELIAIGTLSRFEGKVDLIFTSPPFPLNRKKRYGNEKGEEYARWLCAFGPLFKKMCPAWRGTLAQRRTPLGHTCLPRCSARNAFPEFSSRSPPA